MAKRFGVDVRVTRALLEIGTMCAQLGRHDEAERIIRAVQAHRDDLPHPGTTLAMAYLFQSRLADAEAELDQVMQAFPNHQLGKAFLGWTRRQSGHRGWERMLKDVIDDGRDQWAIRFARVALGYDARSTDAGATAPARPAARAPVFPAQYA